MSAVRFPVEPGHVLTFARAVGDADLAATIPAAGTPVPPTFTSVDVQFDPEHMRGMRPAGVLATPSTSGGSTSGGSTSGGSTSGGSTSGSTASDGDAPGGSVLHAEQHFEYFAPVRVGDVLTVTHTEGRTWTKQGRRGGRLAFREIVKDYRDDRGELVVRSRMVLVDTGRPADDGTDRS